MSQPNTGSDSPPPKRIALKATVGGSGTANQTNSDSRKYVKILPRRRSDSTNVAIRPDHTREQGAQQMAFSFPTADPLQNNSNGSFFLFHSPIVEIEPFNAFRHSYHGAMPTSLVWASSDSSDLSRRSNGELELMGLECQRSDASFNVIREEEGEGANKAVLLEQLTEEPQMTCSEVADKEEELIAQTKLSPEPATRKSDKLPSHRTTQEPRRSREDKPTDPAPSNAKNENVRRSKRKVNPPNFFVTASANDPPLKGDKKEAGKYQLRTSHSPTKSMSMTSFEGSCPSSRRVIRVGLAYQADVIQLFSFAPPAQQATSRDPDRDECVWQPDPDSMNDPKVLEEYCHVARRHQQLQADEALEALYLNDYSITETLNRLEEYSPRREQAEWSGEEIEVFNRQLSRGGKRFYLVAKHLPKKSLADVVEYYYRTKKNRCFLLSPVYMTCPFIESNCVSDPPTTSRSECLNCLKDQGRNTAVKADNRGKKKIPSCPACDFYTKLTKRYRPFTTPLGAQHQKTPHSSPTRGGDYPDVSGPEKRSSPPATTTPHTHCFFVPRLSRLIRGVEWSQEEISTCVKAFRKHGNNFKAIASEFPGGSKDAYDVAEFYINYEKVYRLDLMVSLFERDSIGFAAPTNRLKRVPKETVVATAADPPAQAVGNKRSNPETGELGDDGEEVEEEDEDMDKSEDVVIKTKVRALGGGGGPKSSVLTRNQRARQKVKVAQVVATTPIF